MGKIYGLDYGTNGITLAVYLPDWMKSVTLKDSDGDDITPTKFIDGKPWGKQICGKTAQRAELVMPCVTSAKLHALEEIAYTEDGVQYNPDYVISSENSHKISEQEELEDIVIEELVATHPADMTQEDVYHYRGILEKNTKPGGNNFVIKAMLSEPVAAAFAYLNPDMEEQDLLIADLGGGTADFAIVEFRKLKGEIYISAYSVYGEKLGGYNWDRLFFDFFKKQLYGKGIAYDKDLKFMKELLAKCEEIKINMSTRNDEKVEFDLFSNQNKKYVHFSITKDEYMQIFMKFWGEVKKLCDTYTKKIDPMQINKVLLVGGTCSNVLLQKNMREYFSKAPYQHVKVIAHKEKTAVAIGAANYAHWVFDEHKKIYLGGKPYEKRNVHVELECSDSMGLECMTRTGKYYIGNIIQKGKSFPCTDERIFGIAENNQDSILLQVYRNESKEKLIPLDEGTLIGKEIIKISEITSIPMTTEHLIKATFHMPSQGIVNVELDILDKNMKCQGSYCVPNPFQFNK